MNRTSRTIVGALLPLFLSGYAHASDPDLGRNLSATCAACHGTDGKSAGINANLAGVDKALLVKTLKDFQSGEKPATVMNQLAKGYNDAQIEAIATYLSAQK